MSPTINPLSDRLISQIAAGEVVERPASVVKELVENGLDAGSSDLQVELLAGGRQLVRVADDGCGMDRDDALMAFDRHATSKIKSFEDLAGVSSLGFRGEALAAVAAVSRVELLTAPGDGEGSRVRIEGGRVIVAEPVGRPRGTTVEVQSLFFNVPARRKFLKSPGTELRRSLEVIQGYALAHPQVRFRVEHDGRSLLDALPGAGGEEGLKERIAQLFGKRLALCLHPLPPGSWEEGEAAYGFVGPPEEGRSRRHFVFINGRLIRDRAVAAVFYRSVRAEWRSEDHPPLFLVLKVPPEKLDVNVHPQKSEVRFRDPGFLRRLGAVLQEGLREARREAPAPARIPFDLPRAAPSWEGLGAPGRWGDGSSLEVRESHEKLAEVSYRRAEPRAVPLSGPGGASQGSLKLLGQYKGSLILLESPDGLVLVDQHAAHERILYEELRGLLERGQPASQGLLTPLLLELTPAEKLALSELEENLQRFGFGLEALSGGDMALTAVPSVLSMEEAEKALLNLVAESESSSARDQSLDDRLLEAVAADSACRDAVKIHRFLSQNEMEALVSRLLSCEQPHSCPHGRPTMLKMTDADLERRFGRRG